MQDEAHLIAKRRAAFAQVGNNVVSTGSGTIDLTGLTQNSNSTLISASVDASSGSDSVGSALQDITFYGGAAGPEYLGTGGSVLSSLGTGNAVGALRGNSGGDEIFVPKGFVSGGSLFGTATYDNATFASLELTPGTYTYTWNMPGDSLVIIIGGTSTPVPEPASLAVLGVGIVVAAAARLVRKTGGFLAPRPTDQSPTKSARKLVAITSEVLPHASRPWVPAHGLPPDHPAATDRFPLAWRRTARPGCADPSRCASTAAPAHRVCWRGPPRRRCRRLVVRRFQSGLERAYQVGQFAAASFSLAASSVAASSVGQHVIGRHAVFGCGRSHV